MTTFEGVQLLIEGHTKRRNGFEMPPSPEQIGVILLIISNLVQFFASTYHVFGNENHEKLIEVDLQVDFAWPARATMYGILAFSYILSLVNGYLTTVIDPEDEIIPHQICLQ